MIARLRGTIIDRTANAVIVDVGGVGYLVHVSSRHGIAVGADVDLQIHTHVREDALQLFGFGDATELEVFHLLITVPSIGPVKAMGILESPVEDLLSAVIDRDLRRLSKLQGVGKRTAERMVVDLHDKFAALAPRMIGTHPVNGRGQPKTPAVLSDLVSALSNLGFKPAVAEREAQRAVELLGPETDLDVLLRHTLDQLRRR
jgi:Holliday junction DNA helicase RuvA